jgi:hypothetical protein
VCPLIAAIVKKGIWPSTLTFLTLPSFLSFLLTISSSLILLSLQQSFLPTMAVSHPPLFQSAVLSRNPKSYRATAFLVSGYFPHRSSLLLFLQDRATAVQVFLQDFSPPQFIVLLFLAAVTSRFSFGSSPPLSVSKLQDFPCFNFFPLQFTCSFLASRFFFPSRHCRCCMVGEGGTASTHLLTSGCTSAAVPSVGSTVTEGQQLLWSVWHVRVGNDHDHHRSDDSSRYAHF